MNYKDIYNDWISNSNFDYATKEELLGIKDDREIEDRFYKNLEFGTGGLRGIIGAGTNRMNKYTVRRATLGLANYILKQYGEEGKSKGVAIAFDSRHYSKEFCLEVAKTLAACGIKSYIYDSLRSTPQLSFTVRYLGCIAGVVITASHNPPEYNGYKVYWSDGGQICLDIANEIIKEVNKIEDYSNISTICEKEAIEKNLIKVVGEEIDTAFINAVKSQILRQNVIDKVGNDIKIIYTPIHGTGNKPIRRVLSEAGFKNVIVVKEQEEPDSNFSTVSYPNPEEKEVFNLAIEIAKKENVNVIIGTDPDCDRVGVVVKNTLGEYIVLSGNQVGALLVDYVIRNLVKTNKLPENSTIIKTVVTSELGAIIGESYGVGTINTLTGFKFIGEKIHEFELGKIDKNFIIGYEESYGYLIGTHARDKDGVVASLLICEMVADYYSKGMSLYEGLLSIYDRYGYFNEELKSLTLKGIDGMDKIKRIMNYFRRANIDKIGDMKVEVLKDYSQGIDGLPKSDVIKFIFDDNSWVAIRPSGTEPKIKFYLGVNGSSEKEGNRKLDYIRNYIDNIIEKII